MKILKEKNIIFWIYLALFSFVNFISTVQGLKCYKCNSQDDKNCLEDLSQLQPTDCAADDISCVTINDFKGGVVRDCLNKNGDCFETMCSECKENGCNKHVICNKCDSSTNPKCAQVTSNSKFFPELCSDASDKCITALKDGKHIERKCVNSSVTCDGKKCEICDKALCNKDVFPKDRRLCFQCTKSSSDCNDLKTTKAIPCQFYDANEECYTIGTSATEMNRGCKSDNENQCSGSKCVTCKKDECNGQVYSRNPSRKCYQCGSNEEQCSKEATLCKNPVEYWKQTEEECFTQTVEKKTLRGCVNDRGADEKVCSAENSCTTCNKDGCNSDDGGNGEGSGSEGSGSEGSGSEGSGSEGSGSEGSGGGDESGGEDTKDFTCIRCRSDEKGQETCKDDAKGIEGSNCRNDTLPNDGCFIDKLESGVIIRGCLVDYEKSDRENCERENYKMCSFCKNAPNCNNQKPPNAGSSLHVNLVIYSIVLFTFYLRF